MEFNDALVENEDLAAFGRDTRKDGLYQITRLAVEAYIEQVRSGSFPDELYSYRD
jgi:ketopantoate hydroxymethyltransferase